MSARKAPLPLPPVEWSAALFTSLPESDPDRHDVDPLDEPFAHLAPGYPDTSNPGDFAASVAAGYVDLSVCDPQPAPARLMADVPVVADGPTGRVL